MTSSVRQVTVESALRQHHERLSALERGDGSDAWFEVIAQIDDPAPPSPGYFQNGWRNRNPLNPVRFKHYFNWLYLDGGDGIFGGADNTVVFTVFPILAPKRNYYALLDGTYDGLGMFTYNFLTTGDVVYVTAGLL